MSPHRMKSTQRSPARLVAALAAACALLVWAVVGAAPAAGYQVEPAPVPDSQVELNLPEVEWPDVPPFNWQGAGQTDAGELIPGSDRPFTPEFAFSSSTTQAGAHPTLTFEMRKQRNHCPDWQDDPEENPDRDECLPGEVYIEQDLKRMMVRLPRGLVADANATHYCDAYQGWVDRGYAEYLEWICSNPESKVGTVDITVAGCDPYKTEYIEDGIQYVHCGTVAGEDPGVQLTGPGVVYNERPGEDEQGHLVILWSDQLQLIRSDVSIRVRDDMSIEAVADNVPDWYTTTWLSNGEPKEGLAGGAQISDLVMQLEGSTGEGSGHPLLTNPTFCDSQSVDVEFQGYVYNSIDNRESGDELVPPSGDGKVVTASAPYQATGCDSVPYDPKLSISLDNTGPEAVPAISSTVTQGLGEATTDSVKVTFPSAFKINVENKAEHCSDSDLDAETCPDSSRVGTVTAESPLLPIGERLEGSVYLAGLTGDSVKLSAFLHGFVDLRIDAAGKVEDDLTLTTTFVDLPAVPISRFDLNLEGGDKGLLKTPKVCGSYDVTSEFTSHSGKVATPTQTLEIGGCDDPTLDVSFETRRAGSLTNIELFLSSKGTPIRSVELAISRRLRWGMRKRHRVKKKKRLKSIGQIAFTTTAGETRTKLKAKRTKWGNVSIKARTTKTAEGQVVATEASGFSGSLFRTSRRQGKASSKDGAQASSKDRSQATSKDRAQAARKQKSKKKSKQKRRQTDFTLAGLPQDDLTAVELTLRGRSKRRKFFLRNPTGCKRRLNFVAYVTTADGRRIAVKDRVRIKGKKCQKRRKSRRK